MATKFLDYTGLSYLWGKIKAWCNATFVHLTTDENITGTKTFVGSKKIAFKQSGTNDKLGFTLYNNSNKEQGYLEYNPTNKIANVPLFTLGNYATAADELTYVGFRRYSNISGASGAYNLLAPLISDAKTPFNLTTTYTNFYLPLGVSDGTNIVKASNSGVVDISSLLTLTGYTKASADSALATTDTIKQALGKLEYKIDNVAENIGDTTPIGTILYFAADTAPEGFLACDGTAVSRSLYSDLFDVIGTTYGSGDGSTTFNLPNLVNKFAEGAVTSIGDNVSAGLPNITGTLGWNLSIATEAAESSSGFNPANSALHWKNKSNITGIQQTTTGATRWFDVDLNASRSNSIYGNSSTVQPPAVKLLPCIKAISTSSSNEEATVESLIEGFKEEIEEKFEQLAPKDPLPIGSIVHFASGTVPVGYLVCDGSAVSRSTYSSLFNVIGTTYGSGDGSTTFNVPNLIGRFLEGATSGVGTSVNAGLPNITGTATFLNADGTDNTLYPDSGALFFSQNPSTIQTVNQTGAGKRDLRIDASRSSAVYGNSSTVQPNSVKLLPCIKASYTSLADANAVANFQTTVSNIDGNLVHKINNEIINGWKTFNDGVRFKDINSIIQKINDNYRYINVQCGVWDQGARLQLLEENSPNDASSFHLISGVKHLIGRPNGGLIWTGGRFTLSDGEGGLELFPSTNYSHGGYIDFHYGGDTADYTSRIWEPYNKTIFIDTSTIGTKASYYYARHSYAVKGSTPPSGSTYYWTWAAADKNGNDFTNNRIGQFEVYQASNGENAAQMHAMRNVAGSSDYAVFRLVCKSDNSGYTYSNRGMVLEDNISYNQLRFIAGNYGAFFRNDGADFYILLTAYGNPWGTWNTARPLKINFATGYCDINGGSGYVHANLPIANNSTVPGSNTYSAGINFYPNSGDSIADIFTSRLTNGNTQMCLRVWNYARSDATYLNIYCNGDGSSKYATIPTPVSSSNSTTIATTAWVRTYHSNASDERIKQQIETIPDDVLDAWENISFYQFKFNESVEKKGKENARLHTGVVAQRLDKVFKAKNLDISKYGLYVLEEWEAEDAVYDEKGNLIQEGREAGEQYLVRYTEMLCVEAAYQRRKNKILENRISELEKQVSDMLEILQSLKGAN